MRASRRGNESGSPAEPRLAALVAAACTAGPWESLVARVETADGNCCGWAVSSRVGEPPRLDARFDLASLTKPFVATLALTLERTGELPLDTRIGDVFTGASLPVGRLRLERLLRHRAGLLAWTPLYRRARRPAGVIALLLGGRLLGAELGTYSDLGYILWGLAAERATGRPLAGLLRRHVLGPLGLSSVEPRPRRGDVLLCPVDNGRERELAAKQGIAVATRPAPPRGVVQDGNARFLGGIAGHAGLFGDARSLAALGREWLSPGRVLTRELVDRALAGRGEYALGWARRGVRGSAGPALPAGAFGHTGFAGGSLWCDPGRRRLFVLLGHRRGPGGDLNSWRRRFHAIAADLA